jgi:hypothetical protein
MISATSGLPWLAAQARREQFDGGLDEVLDLGLAESRPGARGSPVGDLEAEDNDDSTEIGQKVRKFLSESRSESEDAPG